MLVAARSPFASHREHSWILALISVVTCGLLNRTDSPYDVGCETVSADTRPPERNQGIGLEPLTGRTDTMVRGLGTSAWIFEQGTLLMAERKLHCGGLRHSIKHSHRFLAPILDRSEVTLYRRLSQKSGMRTNS